MPALREIERACGQRFREFGLGHVADDEPAPIEVLSDGAVHIEQVSVRPEHQGEGFGRALIDQAQRWAAGRGMSALTLTTFGHIPWNRPLYEHLGFRVLTEQEAGPGLRALRDSEAAHGLDPALRVMMHRPVSPSAEPEPRGRGRSG